MFEACLNKGHASESIKAIFKFGITELKLNKKYATYRIENPASGKFVMRNGMIKKVN